MEIEDVSGHDVSESKPLSAEAGFPASQPDVDASALHEEIVTPASAAPANAGDVAVDAFADLEPHATKSSVDDTPADPEHKVADAVDVVESPAQPRKPVRGNLQLPAAPLVPESSPQIDQSTEEPEPEAIEITNPVIEQPAISKEDFNVLFEGSEPAVGHALPFVDAGSSPDARGEHGNPTKPSKRRSAMLPEAPDLVGPITDTAQSEPVNSSPVDLTGVDQPTARATKPSKPGRRSSSARRDSKQEAVGKEAAANEALPSFDQAVVIEIGETGDNSRAAKCEAVGNLAASCAAVEGNEARPLGLAASLAPIIQKDGKARGAIMDSVACSDDDDGWDCGLGVRDANQASAPERSLRRRRTKSITADSIKMSGNAEFDNSTTKIVAAVELLEDMAFDLSDKQKPRWSALSDALCPHVPVPLLRVDIEKLEGDSCEEAQRRNSQFDMTCFPILTPLAGFLVGLLIVQYTDMKRDETWPVVVSVCATASLWVAFATRWLRRAGIVRHRMLIAIVKATPPVETIVGMSVGCLHAALLEVSHRVDEYVRSLQDGWSTLNSAALVLRESGDIMQRLILAGDVPVSLENNANLKHVASDSKQATLHQLIGNSLKAEIVYCQKVLEKDCGADRFTHAYSPVMRLAPLRGRRRFIRSGPRWCGVFVAPPMLILFAMQILVLTQFSDYDVTCLQGPIEVNFSNFNMSQIQLAGAKDADIPSGFVVNETVRATRRLTIRQVTVVLPCDEGTVFGARNHSSQDIQMVLVRWWKRQDRTANDTLMKVYPHTIESAIDVDLSKKVIPYWLPPLVQVGLFIIMCGAIFFCTRPQALQLLLRHELHSAKPEFEDKINKKFAEASKVAMANVLAEITAMRSTQIPRMEDTCETRLVQLYDRLGTTQALLPKVRAAHRLRLSQAINC